MVTVPIMLIPNNSITTKKIVCINKHDHKILLNRYRNVIKWLVIFCYFFFAVRMALNDSDGNRIKRNILWIKLIVNVFHRIYRVYSRILLVHLIVARVFLYFFLCWKLLLSQCTVIIHTFQNKMSTSTTATITTIKWGT